MSESGNQTEEKKKLPLGIIGIVFVLLIAVLGIGIFNNANKEDSSNEISAVAQAPSEKAADVNIIEDHSFNLEKASKPRILGNPDAPIKISEHSSFTCGHCAKFHKTNFKQIKADYVDTGKAYIVFNDMPLSGHDIKIGSIARCVPESSYFEFIQLLFETQEIWLKEDYISYIKQNAKLTGASNEQINNCLNSDELHKVLATQRKDAMDKHNINATPTLVINDNIVILGLSPYEDIKKILDAELEKAVK